MLYPPRAVERAMQIKEVILRTINGEYTWNQAAEILGITARGLRRIRQRMDEFGYQGLVDRRHGRPSPRRTPVAEIERILALYRDRFTGFNVRHFCSKVRREHGVTLSYTCIKQILQGAGLVRKRRSRGRHRMRRERKPRFGQMLHLDGSTHAWLALLPEQRQTLIQVVDDATSRLLYAQLWPGETTLAVMTAMAQLVREYGIPESYYTDRAGWAFETPKAGGKVSKTHLTQVGQALARLGVEHIPSYSPQARGRSERMNRTLQDRLVNELRVAGVRTVEQANAYLLERYLPTHNDEFALAPADPESAFVELGAASLDDIFFEEDTRTVNKDNTVSWEGLVLQIRKQPGRPSCTGLKVLVRRHLDGSYTIHRGRTQCLGRYDPAGCLRDASPKLGKVGGGHAPAQVQAAPAGSAGGESAARVRDSGRLRLPPSRTRVKTAVVKA